MKTKPIISIIAIFFILIYLAASALGTHAQNELPPTETVIPNPRAPVKTLNLPKNTHHPIDPMAEQRERLSEKNDSILVPEAIGGPDEYGYSWSDAVPYAWVDAKALGYNSGLYGDDAFTGPINIGFNFLFYENSYTQLYFNTNGMVTFGASSISWTERPIPYLPQPNNFIAVLWGDFGMYDTIRPDSGIYVYQGGSAPNRFMVIEWYRLNAYYPPAGSKDYTFEVILYENGDIVTQYQTLTSANVSYATVGIEDSEGTDGLEYPYNQLFPLLTGKVIRFYRPANMARIKASPLYQGKFTKAGEKTAFPITIKNIGTLGADTYDFISTYTWPLNIYDSSGVLLTDTNSNGLVDTGLLAQGSSKAVTVFVATPPVAAVGEFHIASLTIRSSIDNSKSKAAELRSSIPAPFAQVYTDQSDGIMNLFLVKPDQQTLKSASGASTYGNYHAVAETPNGNLVYAWSAGRCLDPYYCNVYVEEISFVIYDRNGNVVRPIGKLFNQSGAYMDTYDFELSVAVTPSGNIGFTWVRELWNNNTGQINDNIFFAILNSSGNLVFGPLNLTNNSVFGDDSSYSWPQFYNPRIAATSDNNFFLAWQRYSQEYDDYSLYDIYIAVRDQVGNLVKGVRQYSNATVDQFFYLGGLTPLTSDRVWMGFEEMVAGSMNTVFSIFDSSGNALTPYKLFGGIYGYDIDAVQLSDGRILAGIGSWDVHDSNFYYAILDSNTYNVLYGPSLLVTPSGTRYCYNMSVTADQAARGILTCVGESINGGNPYLIYTLVDSGGSTVTPPMIFRTAQFSQPSLGTSYLGYGNTTYTIQPSTPNIDTYISSSPLVFGPPSGNAKIAVNFGNLGSTTSTSVQVKATLDPSLIYVNDSSGLSPSVSGSEFTWTIPQTMPFLSKGSFEITVTVPGTAYGTQYPVTLTISSSGPEANPSDNTFDLNVIVARQVFLPFLDR